MKRAVAARWGEGPFESAVILKPVLADRAGQSAESGPPPIAYQVRGEVLADVQVVPFYDGGNVFRSIKDILHPQPITRTGNFVEDVNAQNLRVRWSHTVGMGFRLKTPLGGALAVDYGFLLNPSEFLIPQNLNTLNPTTAIYRLHQGQIQFRFTQTF